MHVFEDLQSLERGGCDANTRGGGFDDDKRHPRIVYLFVSRIASYVDSIWNMEIRVMLTPIQEFGGCRDTGNCCQALLSDCSGQVSNVF
jgi:hypothetical protein